MSVDDQVGHGAVVPGQAIGARPQRRWSRWARRACDGVSELLLMLGLALVVGTFFATLGNALPGVEPFEPVHIGSMLVIAWGFLMLAVTVQLPTASMEARSREILGGAWRGVIRSARRLVTHLGLRLSWRRAAVAAGVGAIAGVLGFVAGLFITAGTDLPRAETVSDDPRRAALVGAPQWVAAAFLGLYAAPWEELLFRGALLVTFAAAAAVLSNQASRIAAGALLLAATSIGFGLMHADFSVLNVVTASVAGLVYGLLALSFRSVWPAIVAHTVSNAMVGLVWTA